MIKRQDVYEVSSEFSGVIENFEDDKYYEDRMQKIATCLDIILQNEYFRDGVEKMGDMVQVINLIYDYKGLLHYIREEAKNKL